MAFDASKLLDTLHQLAQPEGYLVAYSGGLDSHVLLHGLASLRPELGVPLRAIHVHHGLQAEADEWQAHCDKTCALLQVPLISVNLSDWDARGKSLEALARDARYAAIAQHMSPGEMLLTAQHQDDQAETLLLQLLRGAGVDGLAGMPLCREWRGGWQARPLLDYARQELLEYARRHGLDWIEDPSNEDRRFDRNYLRHEVMPRLKARWPAVSQTLSRSSRHIAVAAEQVRETAFNDLEACQSEQGSLSVASLQQLPIARCREVLRAWVRHHNAPLPDQARLLQVVETAIPASIEASPQVSWAGVQVRRYRDQLWLIPDKPVVTFPEALPWLDVDELDLPDGSRLRRFPAESGVPARLWRDGQLHVRWRTEQVRCRPQGRQGSRSFKKLCQELGIAPWERNHLPLLYGGEQLLAFADYCLCSEMPDAGSNGFYRIVWHR